MGESNWDVKAIKGQIKTLFPGRWVFSIEHSFYVIQDLTHWHQEEMFLPNQKDMISRAKKCLEL